MSCTPEVWWELCWYLLWAQLRAICISLANKRENIHIFKKNQESSNPWVDALVNKTKKAFFSTYPKNLSQVIELLIFMVDVICLTDNVKRRHQQKHLKVRRLMLSLSRHWNLMLTWKTYRNVKFLTKYKTFLSFSLSSSTGKSFIVGGFELPKRPTITKEYCERQMFLIMTFDMRREVGVEAKHRKRYVNCLR